MNSEYKSQDEDAPVILDLEEQVESILNETVMTAEQKDVIMNRYFANSLLTVSHKQPSDLNSRKVSINRSINRKMTTFSRTNEFMKQNSQTAMTVLDQETVMDRCNSVYSGGMFSVEKLHFKLIVLS